MIVHCLSSAVRSLIHSKSSSAINILGLTTALSVSMVIYLWVDDELGMDKFHEKDEQLFQVMSNTKTNGTVLTREATPIGLAHVLNEEMPGLEDASTVTPIHWFPKFVLKKGELKLKAEGKFVSDGFFNMFTYPVVKGEKIFHTREDAFISETLAVKLFGSVDNAIGETIEWELTDIKRSSTITAIFHDTPPQSTDQFDIVLSIDMLRDIMGFAVDDLNGFGPQTFVTVEKNADLTRINKKLDELMNTKRPDIASDSFYLVKYSSKYLYGNFEGGVQQAGKMNYVTIFILVGIAILILAAVNFINLSTAQTLSRLKEIGVRKVIGASRISLALSRLMEALILCLVALCISLVTVSALMPQLNVILEKRLPAIPDLKTLLAMLVITVTTAFLGGIYPAIQISRLNPIISLKGKTNLQSRSYSRQALVVVQFIMSILAIFFVILLTDQLSYVQRKSLGYEKENVLYFENEGGISKDVNGFIESLKEVQGVKRASSMIGNFSVMGGRPQPIPIDNRQLPMHLAFINFDLIETMEIKVKAGRTFSKEHNDGHSIILNERAVAALGLDDPIGKNVALGSGNATIIGVVKDFHLSSLHDEIPPVVFQLSADRHWNIIVRIEEQSKAKTLERIEKLYKKYNPELPFDYRFLDHELTSLYKAETRIQNLSIYFSIVIIFISVLGLFGLAAFVCKRRAKEIAVRKVAGATRIEIFMMLSRFFLQLILVAIAVALPFGYFLGQEWLNTFAYAIDMRIGMFLLAAIIGITLTLLTVSGFVIQVSRINPASMLKSE